MPKKNYYDYDYDYDFFITKTFSSFSNVLEEDLETILHNSVSETIKSKKLTFMRPQMSFKKLISACRRPQTSNKGYTSVFLSLEP